MRHLVCLVLFGAMLVSSGTVVAGSLDFALGKALFDRIWTPAPASTDATDGLGPLFNARSCASCHPGGGRGHFGETKSGEITGTGLVLRIGDARGRADSVYGQQLQTLAVQGLLAEGRLTRESSGAVRPVALNFGSPDPASQMAGRLAPGLQGLGLLEQVPAHDILALADPEDQNGDGISGRPNLMQDATGKRRLGRFGWKAGKPSVREQSAAALHSDIGLSNPLYMSHFGDCTIAQEACMAAPHGGSRHFENLEIDNQMLDLIIAYVSGLRPVKKSDETAGLAQFKKIGCAACHQPEMTLQDGQVIAPFTDLLLHDLGDALADGIGDGDATGREWRTAPLWGLSRAQRFLHDGRARNLREVISLHGGEAEQAQKNFFNLPNAAQDRLLVFLSHL